MRAGRASAGGEVVPPPRFIQSTATLWCALLASSAVALPAFAEPLRFTPSKDDNYSETMTFVADLEDGTYVLTQVSLTNIGPGTENPVCRVLVAGRSAPTNFSDRFSAGDWQYTPGATAKLRLGTCAVEASASDTTVRANVKGASVTLVYATPPAERQPPDATIVVGGSQHRTTVLHNATPVVATLSLAKSSASGVKGVGYADHSRSEVKPTAIAKRWIRFRALTGPRKLLMLGRETSDGTFGPFWLWQYPTQATKLAKFAVTRSGDKKRPSFEIDATGFDNHHLRIRSKSFLFRHAPVEDLGFLGKVVQPIVGSPVTYTTRATLELTEGQFIDGILEVSVDSE